MILDENKLAQSAEVKELELEQVEEVSDIYTLYYRKGADILSLHFCFPNLDGTEPRDHFHKVIERAKIHCERMRYRFLFCRSYITNLEIEEKRMSI